jgi:hypothetical protein
MTNEEEIGKYDNYTIWGTAQADVLGCGTYNYTVGNATSPLPPPNNNGTQTTPGVPMIPSPTGNPNGLPKTASSKSGADLMIAKVSGSLMLGVAGIFICFL